MRDAVATALSAESGAKLALTAAGVTGVGGAAVGVAGATGGGVAADLMVAANGAGGGRLWS